MFKIKYFEARIVNCIVDQNSDWTLSKKEGFQIFKFSKSKIFFTEKQDSNSSYGLNFSTKIENSSFFDTCPITNGTFYKIEKRDNYYDDEKFYILFGDNCKSEIELTSWNYLKCRYIHKMSLIQREKDKIWILLIGAIFGGLISFLLTFRNYDKGYDTGYKKAKSLYHTAQPKSK
jgi:hypothetical protein